MESFNSLLTAVISVLTIVTSVVSGLYVVHGKLQLTARVQKLDIIKKIREQDERLRAIELNMVKTSDEWFVSLIKKIEKRVDTVDEDQFRRVQDIKVRLAEVETGLTNFCKDYGRIIDLDKEKYDFSQMEKRLLSLIAQQKLAGDDIQLIKKVVASQQKTIKNLSSGGKS